MEYSWLLNRVIVSCTRYRSRERERERARRQIGGRVVSELLVRIHKVSVQEKILETQIGMQCKQEFRNKHKILTNILLMLDNH